MQTPSAGSNDPKTPLLDGSHSASASPLSAHHEAASSNLGDVASVHAGAAQVPAASASPSHVGAAGANDGLRNVRQCVSDVKSIQWPWSKGQEHRQGVINQLKEIALTAKTEDERLAAVDGLKELSVNTWRFGFGSRSKDRYMAMEALRDIGQTSNPANNATQEKVWKAATRELASLMPKSATAVKRFYEVHQTFSKNHRDNNKNNGRIAYLAEKYLEVRPKQRRKLRLEYVGGLTSEAKRSHNHWYVPPGSEALSIMDIGYSILGSLRKMMNIDDWKCISQGDFEQPPDATQQKILTACDWTQQEGLPYVQQLRENRPKNQADPTFSPLDTLLRRFGGYTKKVYTYPQEADCWNGYHHFKGVNFVGTDIPDPKYGEEIPSYRGEFYRENGTFVDCEDDTRGLMRSGYGEWVEVKRDLRDPYDY